MIEVKTSGARDPVRIALQAVAYGVTTGHMPVLDVDRPAEPHPDGHVWYRGWEVGHSFEAEYWSGEGWIAYKGGCDLGAPEVRAGGYQACLDAIDEEEV